MPAQELNVDWAAIEKAAILGVSMEDLSKQFAVGAGTIRKRAWDKQWPIPSKIRRLVEQQREQGNKIKVTDSRSSNAEALKVTAETLQERASAYSLRMFDYASGQVEKAVKAELVPTPDNWKSLDTADRMARRAAGLDKADSQSVTVNLGGWQAAVTAQGVTAQFREVEEVLAGETEQDDSGELLADSEALTDDPEAE